MKTGVQRILDQLKTLDSHFGRNDETIEIVKMSSFELWHSFAICLPARSRSGEGRDFDIWNLCIFYVSWYFSFFRGVEPYSSFSHQRNEIREGLLQF